MTFALTEEECRTAVAAALDELPDWIRRKLGDVAVIIEDSHPRGHVMGVYDPRGGLHRIVIFREANPNVEEVRRTVLHEIGHHFGMSEQQLREAGYG
jgi:predicted Zn-dependent protease with MMP-like domain